MRSASKLKNFVKRADMLLLSLAVICSILGIVAISSATASYGATKYVVVQLVSMGLGIAAFCILTVIDADLIADKWVLLTVFNALFILGLIFFGHDDGTGNRAWYRFFSIGVQPTEVVKVIFIVLIAKQISSYSEKRELNKFKSVFKLALHWFFLFALIVVVSSDLGSALIFLAIFIVMIVAGGIAWYWLGAAAAALAAMIPIMWNFVLKDYQKNRIIAPYAPDLVDPSGTGITWQTNQCKEAMASGRWWGVGYGQGPKTQGDILPAKHTDCIFASIGEEMGMVMCLLIIVLLTVIIIRCVVIGLRSNSSFGMLICFGVAAALAFQTFINIGMCIGITPVIGITLPFFSYGGSSLLTTYAAIGLVSGVKYRPKPMLHSIQY